MSYITLILVGGYILSLLYFSFSQSKINTIIGFSLHKRAFSSFALSFTIIATMVGGTGFANKVNYFHSKGWVYLIITLGLPLQTLLLSQFLIPKCHKALGKVSVGSFMGETYGEKVRVISAILGSVGVCGFIASQIKIIAISGGLLFPQYNNLLWAVLISALIVCIYTYRGGIQSVVLTDVVQCLCFFVSFFVFIYYLYPSASEEARIIQNYNTDRFHLKSALENLDSDGWVYMGTMFLYFFIPSFVPTQFQRIAIARDLNQLTKSWLSASFALCLATILPCIISYFLFIKNPDLPNGEVYKYLLNIIDNPYLQSILIIGVLSMAMSTADSHLNIAAVNLANDTYKKDTLSPLEKFHYARRYVIILCVLAVGLVFLKQDFLKIVLFANSFYMPLITVPLIALIVGYKTTERCLLWTMGITASCLTIWHILKAFSIINIEPAIPLMIFNAMLLVLLHYIIEKWNLLARFGIHSKLNKKRID